MEAVWLFIGCFDSALGLWGTIPPTVPAATVPASAVPASAIPTGGETAVLNPTTIPQTEPGGPISIGMEYVLIDNETRAKRQAGILAEIGATAVKPLGEHIEWGMMQTGPDAPIDFQRLDTFVREYQAVGFTDLVVTLKSHSNWASVNHSLLNSVNAAPKPEYISFYETWIGAIVERYDGDGVDDMATGERRASFYAMKQMVGYLGSYQSIRRLPFEQSGARIYEIEKEGGTVWVAWYEPGHVVLPGEAIPELTVQLAVGQEQVMVEPVIVEFNQTEPIPIPMQTADGLLTLTLTPQPVYIYP